MTPADHRPCSLPRRLAAIGYDGLILLGLWMVLETIAGILMFHANAVSGVAHWAHIGGFVAGLLLMPLLAIGRPPQGEDWNKETEKLFQYEEPKPLTERE